ncbi:MAG: AAA family ATPase, partial [Chloroflexota bacterium]|nr:AAA family ATPase [Chloroflexota bacterium]
MLVGRTDEREILVQHLVATMNGHGRVVFIGGEAGIGKTTLARELEQEAAARGVFVLKGHCYDLTATPPYGPWLDLMARYPAGAGVPPVPDILLEGGIADVRSQAALFAQIQAFFTDVAAAYPCLVILEDLHWADPASLELLRHLARQLAPLPLLLAVTYRVDELTRRHPLYQQLPVLVRDTDGLRIDLRRLDSDDLRLLIETRWPLSATDADRLVQYLDRHADGNPMYVTELLRTLEAEALLYPGTEGWVLAEIDRVVMPPLLRQVIDNRVSRVGEDLREPLAIAAVIGQVIPLDLWQERTGLDHDALLAIAERAVDAHLLEAAPDGTRVRFVHALTREALYESVLPPRRRVWHRQVGEALASRPAPDLDGVAYHFQQAGDSRAVDWLIRAGERAQRAYAWLTAVERFAAAAALLEGVAGSERSRGRLLFRCGRLLRYSQPSRGIIDLAEAERLGDIAGDPVLAAEARVSRGFTRCYADDFRLGLIEMAAGVAALESPPMAEFLPQDATTAWLADALPARTPGGAPTVDPAAAHLSSIGVSHRRGTLPWFLAASGRLAEAIAIGDEFLAQVAAAPPAGDLVVAAIGHAEQGMGIIHASLGRPEAARASFARARAAYDSLDHHAVIAFTLLC